MQPSATIFIVDDDTSVLHGLARLMRSAGYQVEAYSSAPEFLARKAVDTPGCILMDLRMPDMDGLELQSALHRAGHNWPVIFISGATDIPATVRAMKAGAVDFLTKPFEERQLLAVIENALLRDAESRACRNQDNAIQELFSGLTPREREVCVQVAQGLQNKQIAWQLGISEKTVKVHRARVMEKLHAGSVADLVRLADRSGVKGAQAGA